MIVNGQNAQLRGHWAIFLVLHQFVRPVPIAVGLMPQRQQRVPDLVGRCPYIQRPLNSLRSILRQLSSHPRLAGFAGCQCRTKTPSRVFRGRIARERRMGRDGGDRGRGHGFQDVFRGKQPARPHYDNMVDANFRDVGISVVDGYYQGPAVFVTMDFGRPEDLPPPPPSVYPVCRLQLPKASPIDRPANFWARYCSHPAAIVSTAQNGTGTKSMLFKDGGLNFP